MLSVCQNSCTNYIPMNYICMSTSFALTFILRLSVFIIVAILMGLYQYLIVIICYISLMTHEVVHIFKYLLTIENSIFLRCVFSFLSVFLLGYLFLIDFSSQYIFNRSPLFIWIINIFSHTVAFHSHNGTSDEEMPLILMQFYLLFFIQLLLFCVLSENSLCIPDHKVILQCNLWEL